MASGQRPINNVVDITNYVMLLTGQPLHAFDWDLVAGGHLVVRRAGKDEKMFTLDDVERTLDPDVLLICDDEGPTSIAGIMGGQRSEVQPTTTRVLMEAANWNGPNLQRTSQRLGLRTEASGRFEKQLAPEQTMDGQAVATRLMIELCGARLVPGTVDVGGPGPDPATLRLRDEKVTRLLGTEVPVGEQRELLERLEFGVVDGGDYLDVTVPYFRRNDVTREVDLIEEVARLWGLEKLPATLPAHGSSGRLTREQKLRRRAGDALVGVGFSEAIGWSFEAPDMARRLRIDGVPPVRLRNPLSEDLSVMRTTLLGSLLASVRHNTARGADDVRLFEEGSVYFDRPHGRELTAAEARSTPLPDERMHLAALMTGRVRPASWGDADAAERGLLRRQGRAGDAADARCACRGASSAARTRSCIPGRAARVLIAGEDAGWLGELHPGVAGDWDLGRDGRLRAGPRRRAPARGRRAALRGPDLVPGDPPGPGVLDPRRALGRRPGRRGPRRRRQAPARRAGLRRLRPRGPDVAGGAARVPRR